MFTADSQGKGVFALDCQFFRGQIVSESYGELEPEGKPSLEAHLQECCECKQFRVELREVQHALNQWEDIDHPINIGGLRKAILL